MINRWVINRWVINGNEWCKSEDVERLEKRLKKADSIIAYAHGIYRAMNTTNATLSVLGLVDLLERYMENPND